MNPFDLPGPAFLLFYLALSAAVLVAVAIVAPRLVPGFARPPLDDPYALAVVRGGAAEAIRVATISLIDRNLLWSNHGQLRVLQPDAAARVRRPLERRILALCEEATTSKALLADAGVRSAAELIAAPLDEQGLTSDSEPAQLALALGAIAVLGGAAVTKLWLAAQRGHPDVGFLLLLSVLACVAAARLAIRPSRRRRLLEDLQLLFSRLQDGASALRAGGATADAVLLAAVFGLPALPGGSFPHAEQLFPESFGRQRDSGGFWDFASSWSSDSSSCSSSCGSSCGGGCGGGCGGCGS